MKWALALLALLSSAAFADTQKPLVLQNGGLRQIASSDTLAINGVTLGPAGIQTPLPITSGPINQSNISSNWIETLRPYSTTISQAVTVSTIGQIALLGASRSAGNGCGGGCMGTMGGEFLVLNDNVASNQRQFAYAGYFEATRAAGAGTTHGVEIDVRNRGSLVTMAPNAMFGDGVTVGGDGTTPGLWLASGAGETGSADNSVALGIVSNGARWRSGIMFDANGLVLRGDNKYEALALSPKQAISFFDAAGVLMSNIYSSSTAAGSQTNLDIMNNSVAVENAAGTPQFSVSNTGATYQRGPHQLLSVTYGSLPTCNTAAAGTLAFINDASAAITAWHQQVTAGGGSNTAFIACNGSGWFAFDY